MRAQLQTVAEADTNLIAAQVRHNSGVATIADVLQAQTVLSQAQLDLETDSGTVRTNHGNLATAMGLRADAAFEVAMPSDSLSDRLSRRERRLAYRERARQSPRPGRGAREHSAGAAGSARRSLE